MSNQIKKGSRFRKTYRGMSVTSHDAVIDEVWEVTECLDNSYECKLLSSNAVMEINDAYRRFFTEDEIKNA